MAAVVQSPSANNAFIVDPATSGTIAFASNVTAGNLVVAVLWKLLSNATPLDPVVGDFTKSAGTATIGAFSLDAVVHNNYDAGNGYGPVAIASAPVTGTGSCTIQFGTGAGQYCAASLYELSGVDVSGSRVNGTSQTPNPSAFQAASTSASSGNVSLPAGGGIIIGAMTMINTSATITQDGAFTLGYENESNSNAMGSTIYQINAGSLTDSADWTLGASNPWAAIAVAYKNAGGGGGSPAGRLLLLGAGS